MPVLCNLHATAMGRARARQADSGGWRECSRMEQVYRDVTVRDCAGAGRGFRAYPKSARRAGTHVAETGNCCSYVTLSLLKFS